MELTVKESMMAIKAKIENLLDNASNEKAKVHLRKAHNFMKRAEEMQTGHHFDRCIQKALEHTTAAQKAW